MSLLRSMTGGLRSLFRKKQVSQELDEELNGFLEMAAEEKVKQGMSRKDALRAVRLERGSLEVTKEVVRSAGWESFVETCSQDLRFGLRMLLKSPVFTAVVRTESKLLEEILQKSPVNRREACATSPGRKNLARQRGQLSFG
jgi:hypothetical protein